MAFLESPPGEVDLAEKSYRTWPYEMKISCVRHILGNTRGKLAQHDYASSTAGLLASIFTTPNHFFLHAEYPGCDARDIFFFEGR